MRGPRPVVAIGLLMCLAGGVSGAETPPGSQPVQLNIEAQQLDRALNVWALQTGYQILMPVQQGSPGQMSPALNGRYTPESALRVLLASSDLKYQFINARTVTIRLAGDEQPPLASARGRALGKDAAVGARASTVNQGIQASAQGDDVTEQVIVTAQKRSERVQDVPISIAVLGGDALDRSPSSGVTEALNRVPGVATTVNLQGAGTQVAVRGVTAGGALFNGASPIAYYLDSVPFGLVKTAIAPDASPYDLERVEVLRGPQGTLYGASAQNGVVRVLTNDADLSAFELKGRVAGSGTANDGAGNYRGDLAVNVPIVDGRLAGRAVVGYENWSGWINSPARDGVNDAQLRNFRLKLNGLVTDNLSIGLSAWLARNDFGAPSTSDDEGRITSVSDQSISTDYDAYGLRINYELPSFSVLSQTSYLDFSNRGAVGLEVLGLPPLFTGLDARVFAQELLLNSEPSSTWRWSAGVFYRDANDRLRQNNLGGGAPFDYANASRSHAVFGEVGRRFLDGRLEWTLGARYFHDDVLVKENISQGAEGEPPLRTTNSFHANTPRAVLTWYPVSDVTVYASYSQGFRSGFPQDPGVARTYPTFPALKPDKLHNYEIGSKATLLGGRLSFDTALYYLDWRKVQQTLTVPFNGTDVTALVNGKSASGIGVDFAMTVRPLRDFSRLELSLNGGWNDLSMDSVVISQGAVLFNEGDRLNLSPEYTIGGSADYTFAIGSAGYSGRLSMAANYTARQDQRTIAGGNLLIARGEPIFLSRASFAISAPTRWTATVFGENLNNEQDAVIRDPSGIPDWTARPRPRTVGVQVEYRF